MTAPSLERRLIGWLVALYLGILLVAIGDYFAVAILRGVAMAEGFEVALEQTAASLTLENGKPVLRPTPALIELAAHADFAVAVADDSDRHFQSVGQPPADAATLLRLTQGDIILGDHEGRRRAVIKPLSVEGTDVTVLIVRTQTFADVLLWMMHEISEELLPLVVPLLIGSLIVVPWTVRRSLAPLRLLGFRIAAIGPGERGSGLTLDGVPREVAPLVKAVDSALARLQAAVQQQRRFTANAAHELRTPLAVLRTRLEGLAPSDEREALIRDTDRMCRLVAQLLAMARLEARQIAEAEEVDLADLGVDVIADLAPLAIAEGKEIVLERAAVPVRRHGKRAALSDAVRNLVENALRFTARGGVVTVLIDPAGAIVVRDQGPGVPAENRDRVFEPFWRASTGGGAGLGLAIVAETAAAHGGSVSVTDAPGGGADFRHSLPAA